MTTEDCRICQGRGFRPKEFRREGVFIEDSKPIWLIETESCYFCFGSGKKDNRGGMSDVRK